MGANMYRANITNELKAKYWNGYLYFDIGRVIRGAQWNY